MVDVELIYSNFESFIKDRNVLISKQGNINEFIYLDVFNYFSNPDPMKVYLQTRIIDYLYNPDNQTLDYSWNLNKGANVDPNNNSIDYYLFSKNKYMGMVIEVTDFVSNEFVKTDYITEFLSYVYSSVNDINGTKPDTYSSDILKKGCLFHDVSQENYFISNGDYKALFFPSNITKCEALNIAYLENDMFDDNNKEIYANLYFKNPVSNIIFNYKIMFTRDFTYC